MCEYVSHQTTRWIGTVCVDVEMQCGEWAGRCCFECGFFCLCVGFSAVPCTPVCVCSGCCFLTGRCFQLVSGGFCCDLRCKRGHSTLTSRVKKSSFVCLVVGFSEGTVWYHRSRMLFLWFKLVKTKYFFNKSKKIYILFGTSKSLSWSTAWMLQNLMMHLCTIFIVYKAKSFLKSLYFNGFLKLYFCCVLIPETIVSLAILLPPPLKKKEPTILNLGIEKVLDVSTLIFLQSEVIQRATYSR